MKAEGEKSLYLLLSVSWRWLPGSERRGEERRGEERRGKGEHRPVARIFPLVGRQKKIDDVIYKIIG